MDKEVVNFASFMLLQEKVPCEVLVHIFSTDTRTLNIFLDVSTKTLNLLCVYFWVVRVHERLTVIDDMVGVPIGSEGSIRWPSIGVNDCPRQNKLLDDGNKNDFAVAHQ